MLGYYYHDRYGIACNSCFGQAQISSHFLLNHTARCDNFHLQKLCSEPHKLFFVINMWNKFRLYCSNHLRGGHMGYLIWARTLRWNVPISRLLQLSWKINTENTSSHFFCRYVCIFLIRVFCSYCFPVPCQMIDDQFATPLFGENFPAILSSLMTINFSMSWELSHVFALQICP